MKRMRNDTYFKYVAIEELDALQRELVIEHVEVVDGDLLLEVRARG